MNASNLIRFLNRAGWEEIRQQGQHRIFAHATNTKLIAIPDLGKNSLNVGLLNDILKEAGFEKARLRKLEVSFKWLGFFSDMFKKKSDH